MKTLKKAYHIFTRIEIVLTTLLFLFMTGSIVFDVIRRKLWGISLPWIEELGRYTLVYCTMIAASMGITSDGHPRMDAVVGLLKGKALKVVRILSNVISSAGCLYLSYWAFVHVSKMIKIGTMTTSLGFPLWICYAIMPVGMIGISVRSLALVLRDIKNFNVLETHSKIADSSGLQQENEEIGGST